MAKRYKRIRRRHRKKIWKRSHFRLYLGITIMCFLVAFILYLVVEKGGRIFKEGEELTAKIPEGVSAEDIQKVLKEKDLDEYKASEEFENLKKAYKDKLDPAEVERLKKKYKELTEEAP